MPESLEQPASRLEVPAGWLMRASLGDAIAITLTGPFVNNQVDPKSFSAPAVKFASFLPKTDDPCGKVFYSKPTVDDWTNWITRIGVSEACPQRTSYDSVGLVT